MQWNQTLIKIFMDWAITADLKFANYSFMIWKKKSTCMGLAKFEHKIFTVKEIIKY